MDDIWNVIRASLITCGRGSVCQSGHQNNLCFDIPQGFGLFSELTAGFQTKTFHQSFKPLGIRRCKDVRYHPDSCFGRGITMTSFASWPFGIPMFLQHGAHSKQGLSPRRISPTTENTAGTLVHARQLPSSGGVICVVKGYPERGS